jgi:Flp pilus assembly protein TadD
MPPGTRTPRSAATSKQTLRITGRAGRQGLHADGNQPGQAVTLNNLGQLALQTADLDQASRHYGLALAIARGINAPTDQARALEGLGQVHLRNGDSGEAASHLRQALTIYHRAGTPADVHRIEETLRRHEL